MELLDSINALLQMAGLPPLPQDTTEANVSERLAIIVEAAAQSAAVADGTVAMTNLQSRLRPGAKIRSLNLQAAKARARIGRQAP